MNLFHQELMKAPSITGPRCAICGDSPTTNHHLVPKSQGGAKGPVISLCGHGTVGCHGKAEDKKLHFHWTGSTLMYLVTDESTKYATALGIGGWKPIGRTL